MNTMQNARNTPIVALFAALAFLPLAGCAGGFGGDPTGPMADLEASSDEPWAGEPVTFDGQASKAPGDDKIVTWRFDFGDGITFEADNEDEARVQHVYAESGVYTVTLTVESAEDADDQDRERDSTSMKLGVGDRMPVQAALVNDPLDIDAGSNETLPIVVKEDATTFDLNLTVTSATGFGSSRAVITLVDPSGTELASKDVSVDAGESEEIDLSGPLVRTGTHELRMVAESGAVDIVGTIEIRYDPDVPN